MIHHVGADYLANEPLLHQKIEGLEELRKSIDATAKRFYRGASDGQRAENTLQSMESLTFDPAMLPRNDRSILQRHEDLKAQFGFTV